jgi:hypothetical protein
MWTGSVLGGALVSIMQPAFLGGEATFDPVVALRASATFVMPLLIVFSLTVLPLMVRFKAMNLPGFLGAGLCMGCATTVLCIAANKLVDWFFPVSTKSVLFVMSSSVAVSVCVWLVSLLVDLKISTNVKD